MFDRNGPGVVRNRRAVGRASVPQRSLLACRVLRRGGRREHHCRDGRDAGEPRVQQASLVRRQSEPPRRRDETCSSSAGEGTGRRYRGDASRIFRDRAARLSCRKFAAAELAARRRTAAGPDESLKGCRCIVPCQVNVNRAKVPWNLGSPSKGGGVSARSTIGWVAEGQSAVETLPFVESLHSSDNLWPDITVEENVDIGGPRVLTELPLGHVVKHILLVPIRPHRLELCWAGGASFSGTISPGTLTIVPANQPYSASWVGGTGRIVALQIAPALAAATVSHDGDCSGALEPIFSRDDPFVTHAVHTPKPLHGCVSSHCWSHPTALCGVGQRRTPHVDGLQGAKVTSEDNGGRLERSSQKRGARFGSCKIPTTHARCTIMEDRDTPVR